MRERPKLFPIDDKLAQAIDDCLCELSDDVMAATERSLAKLKQRMNAIQDQYIAKMRRELNLPDDVAQHFANGCVGLTFKRESDRITEVIDAMESNRRPARGYDA